MSFVQNFSPSQNIVSPSVLILDDTSTGIDGSITDRFVTIQTYDGTYLKPIGNSGNSIEWTLSSGNTIDIDCMDKDYAILITVSWFGGSTVLYTKQILAVFTAYARTFRVKLLKALESNPNQIDSVNFFNVFSGITCYIDGADESIALMNDITLSQLCNTKAKYFIDNPALSF